MGFGQSITQDKTFMVAGTAKVVDATDQTLTNATRSEQIAAAFLAANKGISATATGKAAEQMIATAKRIQSEIDRHGGAIRTAHVTTTSTDEDGAGVVGAVGGGFNVPQQA